MQVKKHGLAVSLLSLLKLMKCSFGLSTDVCCLCDALVLCSIITCSVLLSLTASVVTPSIVSTERYRFPLDLLFLTASIVSVGTYLALLASGAVGVESRSKQSSGAVVSKLFIVPYPFKHSISSCVPPLAPGSARSQMFLASL